MPQAIAFAKKDPRIPMFIWFVFRDSAGSPWQSGVYRTSGAAKPAAAKWAAAAKGVDKLNGKVSVKGGTANPLVNVNYRDMCTNNVPGTAVGVTWRAVLGNSNIPAAAGQTSTQLCVRLHDHGPPHGSGRREGPHLPGRDRREHGHDTGQAEDHHDRRHLAGWLLCAADAGLHSDASGGRRGRRALREEVKAFKRVEP